MVWLARTCGSFHLLAMDLLIVGKGSYSYSKVYEVDWLVCAFAVSGFKVLYGSLKEEIDFLIRVQHPHIARLICLSVNSKGGWITAQRRGTDLQRNLSVPARVWHLLRT